MPLVAMSSVGRPVMSSPAKVTVPAVGSSRLVMHLKSVDLPAPFVPSRATISPS
jgi:hypothetical protein